MAQKPAGPRKPATKFPHLRKQMQKNALPIKPQSTKFGMTKRKGGKP